MRLTAQQRAAVEEADRHVLVIACPGSGKTRTIIARLIRSIELVRGTPRRVACITYTNAAANEIESRVRHVVSGADADYCDIGTIHAFCLRSIIRLFHHRLPGYEGGYAIAPPDSDGFLAAAEQAINDCGLSGAARVQEFERVRRGLDGGPLIPSDVGLTDESVSRFWTILNERALIDFPNVTYLTYLLLHRFPHIARSVSSRFREILIDEMQDTDALQVQLLRCLADAGRSRFVLVGDPEQSIYGFAGAEPERMFEFATHLNARDNFPLSKNWRSSEKIVAFAEAVRPRHVPMEAAGPNRDFDTEPQLVAAQSPTSAVVGGFLPALEREGVDVASAAVLAPAWYMLIPIARELRRIGVPVSGPGSRPYNRRGRLLTGLLEHVCACVHNTRARILPRIQYEIFDAIQNTEGKSRYEVWGRPGRLAATELIFKARELREIHQQAVPWIEKAAEEFGTVLSKYSLIGQEGKRALVEAGQSIIADIRSNRNVDIEDLPVEQLGTFANPDGSMRLLTFHAAKGREFDAVCIVELQEGNFPHPRGSVEESRRVFYVAVTRARKLLILSHRRGRDRCRFLNERSVAGSIATT